MTTKPPDPQAPPAQAMAEPDIAQACVLIVDDNRDSLFALKEGLASLNVRILTAESGREALRILLEETVAAILLDVLMPDMDGFETAELIRSHAKTKFTPILFITGVSKSDENIQKGYVLGAVDYILKPVNVEILKSKVKVFVDLHNMRARERIVNRQLQKLTEELTRSNKDLEHFAYIASHDLQEPLRSIDGFLHLVKQRAEGRLDQESIEYMDRTIKAAGHMRDLILGLLAFSRINTKGRPFEMVDLEQTLCACLEDLNQAVSGSKAEITHAPLGQVLGDHQQLKQLFENLLSNAIKYRAAGPPRIHISVREELNAEGEKSLLFSVQDNGIGIDSQYAETIFLMFKRLHTNAQYTGTGIGLALCKKIVERHGGRIWVDSETGKGSTFCFTLPVRAESRTLHGATDKSATA